MSPDVQPLTLDAISRYGWQDEIACAGEFECSAYSRLFYARSRQLGAEDPVGREVFRFLGDCTSPLLRPESPDEPFGPMAEWDARRTPVPDDIPEAEAALLPDLAQFARDPEVRARLADLAWLRRRDYASALLAIEAYVESARRLDAAGQWTNAKDRAERALRLAAKLGPANRAHFDRVVAYVEGVVYTVTATGDRRYQPAQLMALLLDLRAGDADRGSSHAEALAYAAEAEEDHERAEAYWQTKASWDRRRGDDAARRAAEIRAAESRAAIAGEHLAWIIHGDRR